MLDNLLNPLPSPSPTLYAPSKRHTAPHSVLVPISSLELAQSKTTSNPLRTHPRFAAEDYVPRQSTSMEHAGITQERGGGGGRKRPVVEEREGEGKRMRVGMDKEVVATHYNTRPNLGRQARDQSPIIGLKNFNNWIKSVLIAKYGRREKDKESPRVKVLDLGCGKGGDLQKWLKAGTDEYIGMDLAAVSVEQARSRYDQLRGPKFQADFIACDCYERSIADVLTPAHTRRLFDVVSMQFCLHYAFETEEKARMMFENVVRFLKPGGVLIGTIPDQVQLLDKLKARTDEFENSSDPPPGNPLEFGNGVYKVTFDSSDPTPRFGHRYTFFLKDAVEEVPEYVVYWSELIRLAEEYGLGLKYRGDFQSIFMEEQEEPDFKLLLARMKVVDANGDTELTVDQWEAATLYLGFVLYKLP